MGTIGRLAPCACAAAAVLAAAAVQPAGARVLGANRVTRLDLISNAVGVTHCQFGEQVPRATRAIRLSLKANGASGPVVAVAVLAGDRAVAGGARGAGWRGDSVVVPLSPAPRRTLRATLCMTAAPEAEVAALGWNEVKPPAPGVPGGPRVQAAYLDRLPPADAGARSGPLALARALLRLLAA